MSTFGTAKSQHDWRTDDVWRCCPRPKKFFSFLYGKQQLTWRDRNGENRERLSEASKSSSDMDLHMCLFFFTKGS